MDSLTKADIDCPDLVVLRGHPDNEDAVDDLAVLPTADGRLASWWQPNAEERAAILRGEQIHLHIWCSRHPCVALTVQGVNYPPQPLKR